MTIFGVGKRSSADRSAGGLRVDVDIRGGCAVVSPRGELDMASAERLDDTVAAAAGMSGLWQVEIDSAGLGFVDVAGLASLLRARDVVEGRGLRYRLSGRSPALQRMLDLAGVGGRVADHALN